MAFSPNVVAVRFHLPDLDEAFPDFLKALTALHESVARHDEPREIDVLLQRVIRQSVVIFRREEEAMDITRDRMAAGHRGAHQKFLRTLGRSRDSLRESGPSIGLAMDMRRDLVDWMGEHHLLMDATLGRHIRTIVDRSMERLSA